MQWPLFAFIEGLAEINAENCDDDPTDEIQRDEQAVPNEYL